MRLLRGSAILIAVLSAVLMALGQNSQTFPQKQYYASDYGTWSVLGQYPNTYLFSPPGVCLIPSPSVGSFNAFNANAPVYIRDAVAASSEVVTPTSVVATESFCGINASTAHSHTSFSLQSATGGLQEVLNQIAPAIPYAAEVILDRNWFSMVNSVPGQTTSAVIASVKGSNAAILEDITQAPQLFYRWNGTQYVAVPNNGSVASVALSMPSIFGVTGSPCTVNCNLGTTLNSEAQNTALRGPASGSPAVPGFRTDTAADVAQAGALYNSIASANINGMMYPAQCGSSNPPSWCAGTTADAWIRAACTQLPTSGGTINLLGLTGTLAAAITGCMSPTKQVIFLQDDPSRLNITEADGGVVWPLDNGSMLLGPGAGQCNFPNGGIHLASTANVAAIVGPAHTDGTQEALTANGLCLFGAAGATVTKGILWADKIFTNTSFNQNNIQICNTACVRVQDVGGSMTINGNLLGLTDGVNSITGSPLIIDAVSTGSSAIEVASNTIQDANGGAGNPEIKLVGAAGKTNQGIWIHDDYIERAGFSGTTGDVVGIQVTDCLGCKIENIVALGVSGGTNFIEIDQDALGQVRNVELDNILAASWTNVVNDTTPGGKVLPYASTPYLTTYYAQPGYQQPPVLPQNTIQFLTTDLMAGQGSLSTGSGTFGTNFGIYGCVAGPTTCVYTRTNSTAPPGYTFSQQVQITANTIGGDNGIEFSTGVPFTAGQSYQVSFWMKGDGTFTGIPLFVLGDPNIPTQYCSFEASGALTTTWTLFTSICTPSASSTSFLSFSTVATPVGATGTFWIGGMIFAPVAPLAPGGLLTSVAPYGIGPATNAQQTITLGTTALLLGNTYTTVAGLASVTAGSVSATAGSFTALVAGSATVSGIATVGQLAMSGGRKGTFICTAGGTIPITNANELASSDVVISMNAAAGTITTPPAMKTVTAGTGFTVLCGASDTSTYNYDILN